MSVKEEACGGSLAHTSDSRTSPRFAFSAVAEVVDLQSGTHMAVRVADIGANGCYTDALNVLPAGTAVMISIQHAGNVFKTPATVSYALASMGMGLHFSATTPEISLVLEKWIAEARGEIATPRGEDAERGNETGPSRIETKVLNRLVRILKRKEILSEADATALLEALSHES